MPQNKFQRLAFAFITVVITVHAYVFYSLYVVNGTALMSATGASSVLGAIRAQGGVYMLGRFVPIWAVVLTEFCLAYLLEVVMGSPCSFKLARRVFDPQRNHPMIFETAIICATVGLMCPAMSLLAAVLYYPYYAGFHFATLLANWIKLVCFNFPFAYFTQLFFIQPLVRTIFKALFHRSIKAHVSQPQRKSTNESEAIAEIFRRIDLIKEELALENTQTQEDEDTVQE